MTLLKLIPLIACVFIVSCASTNNAGRYRIESIGNAQRSIDAKIIAANPVYIQGNTSGVGAALGGVAGGGIAGNNSNNVAVIIAGIIGGIVIGEYIEGANNLHEATEYVMQTSTDAILTVAQVNEGNEIFIEGDKVILVYGYPAKLLKDPR